jgi:dGTPase
VRAQPAALVRFSETVAAEHLELKHYLRDHVYRHYRVLRMTNKAHTVIRSMFDSFFARPELLPDEHHQSAKDMESEAGENGRARAVADYIAGMTDRYAIVEHERLFDPAKRS